MGKPAIPIKGGCHGSRNVQVTLNMAVSLDGRVAHEDGAPAELSGPEDWARVHRARAQHDAILVGVTTVLTDDPRLTARIEPTPEHPPLRVVLDTDLRTPPAAHLLDDAAGTLILTGPEGGALDGADVVALDPGPRDLARVLEALEARDIGSLLVEGGPRVAASFLEAGLVDRWTLYTAPVVLGAGPSLWEALSDRSIRQKLNLRAIAPLGPGHLATYEAV